ncbi:MAG: helix-turn-helix transcriptional regulator [Anaerolineae bacterium]|nr:helix-turn-helix transcriptional regulator [Anaerolineae bacterium]
MSAKQEPNVGQRIRALREKRGLSLRSLSDKSGLSINAISRIERGENSPTVSSLHQLASALEVPITDFFMDEHEQNIVFIKSNDRLITQREGMAIESLGIGLRQQLVQPFLITLEPGVGTLQEPITHPGQEFVFCLDGEIAYRIGEQRFELTPGDSLLFEAAQPHGFKNMGESPATILITFNNDQSSNVARQRHLTA